MAGAWSRHLATEKSIGMSYSHIATGEKGESIHISTHFLTVPLFIHLPTSLLNFPSIHLPICASAHLSFLPSICSLNFPSIHALTLIPCAHLPTSLPSIHSPTCPPTHSPICLSISSSSVHRLAHSPLYRPPLVPPYIIGAENTHGTTNFLQSDSIYYRQLISEVAIKRAYNVQCS